VKDLTAAAARTPKRLMKSQRLETDSSAGDFEARGSTAAPNTKPGLSGEMTLEQACPSEYQRAQCAFKDSMIH
jgi:hypothetical protein